MNQLDLAGIAKIDFDLNYSFDGLVNTAPKDFAMFTGHNLWKQLRK